MKNILFAKLLLLFAILNAKSQNLKFGAFAGATLGTQKQTLFEGTTTLGSTSILGLTLGTTADIKIFKKFSLQLGLNFTQKHFTVDSKPTNSTLIYWAGSPPVNLYYIELPLNLLINLNPGKGMINMGIGSTLGYGFGGKYKFPQGRENVIWGNSANANYKPFDFGLNLVAGYEFIKGLTLGLNYNIGLLNLSPNNSSTVKINYLSFRVGYIFQRSKGKN